MLRKQLKAQSRAMKLKNFYKPVREDVFLLGMRISLSTSQPLMSPII
jgi:hypothetical protein